MTSKRTLVFVAVVNGLAGIPTVSADDGLVLIRGGAAEHAQTTIGAAIETATREAGWTLPSKPPAKKLTDALWKCADSTEPWACLLAANGALELRRLFVVGVENEQSQVGVPIVVITAKVIVTDPRSVIVRQRYCSQCADDKLGSESAELATQILREVAVRSGRTVAHLKSKPTGAQIILDGTLIGATDSTFNTYPGKHVVRFEKPGYQSQDLEFTAEEGKTAEVTVTLEPSAEIPRPPSSRPSRLMPGVVIGTGLALVITGAALIVADEDVSLTGKQPATFTNTAALGLGVTAAGAAITIGGAYWFLQRSKARSAPTASLVPGGGVVGWLGTF